MSQSPSRSPTPSDSGEPLGRPRPLFLSHEADSDVATSTFSGHNRQSSSVSFEISPSHPQTPRHDAPDPFYTPTAETANPFSPPPSVPTSVVSFSMNAETTSSAIPSYSPEIGRYPSREVHQRSSAQSSVHNSVIDLRSREIRPPMGGIRESFAAPPLRPSVKHSKTFSSAPTSIRVKEAVRPRHRSTMLTGPIDKPWLTRKDTVGRVAYFITIGIILLGVVASALRCWSDWRGVKTIGNLCLVLEDQFESSDLDTTSVWQREGDMGGFGNGEFEMTTASTNNSFIKNNNLYILPTLTSDVIGRDAILDGYTYNLTGCTNTNLTACGAVSNQTLGTVINPVMSARISTKGKKSIRYGRVEVRAKIPTGDWMWPAIWMLPENDTYGPWPMSGEIDIMEARGNGPSYPAQGTNYVRGSLNWGPVTWLNAVSKTFGWWTVRRSSFDQGFHTYALEWTDKFLRIYVDNRLQHMLELSFNIPFFQRGDFPASVTNASSEIILQNPWANSGNSAPFDQPFYLILDVAIGGTNGWFPDAAGNKPWLNGELDAMRKFALTQDDWSSTWPTDEDQRAMIVDYVKMWQLC